MKKRKIINFTTLLTLTLFLNACIISIPVINSFVSSSQINSSGTFDGEWSNEEAVIASMYIDTARIAFGAFVENIDNYFNNLHYKKLYIMQKQEQILHYSFLQGYVELLFILNESGEEKQQEFIEQLYLIDLVASAYKCNCVPYETIDTRELDITQATINLGEELTINCIGYLNEYYQQFDFNYIEIELKDFDDTKTYTPADFPQVNLKSVIKNNWNNTLRLELIKDNYFNFIKSCNILSRILNIKALTYYIIMYDLKEPPSWVVSDDSIIDIIDFPYESYVTIKGISKGITTISYGHLSCEITVV